MKEAYDYKHVQGVNAWAIVHEGSLAGRLVANWSDNPAGRVCTVTLTFWAGPMHCLPRMTGNAGGGGYCKLSAAYHDAFHREDIHKSDDLEMFYPRRVAGAGEGAMRQHLRDHGYQTFEVI